VRSQILVLLAAVSRALTLWRAASMRPRGSFEKRDHRQQAISETPSLKESWVIGLTIWRHWRTAPGRWELLRFAVCGGEYGRWLICPVNSEFHGPLQSCIEKLTDEMAKCLGTNQAPCSHCITHLTSANMSSVRRTALAICRHPETAKKLAFD
jgi:hypothetical protein